MTDLKEHYLFPCMVFCSREPYVVTTVLGSCVSVCLFDEAKKYGGINHYMLPFWNGHGLESPKFGNIAIAKLIEEMTNLGCDKKKLKAKIFGGGKVLAGHSEGMNVGARNVDVAVELLEAHEISVIASSVGDIFGRKILFNTSTGQIMMKKVGADTR